MTNTSLAFLGYVSWMLLLTVAIVGQRTALILAGRRAANDFSTTGEDVSPFAERLCRAHANAYEHFPVIGGLLLYALATGQTAVTEPLTLTVLAARLLQGSVHLVSTSVVAVFGRFGFFAVQIGIAVFWTLSFLNQAVSAIT
jgi:uncharacterized MAPEG superfamily protein